MDSEDAKAREIERLQNSLQAMRKKVDEATALLFNEREIAQKILEDARLLMNPVKDSIHDAETIKTLHLEVENLKVSISYIYCIYLSIFISIMTIIFVHFNLQN